MNWQKPTKRADDPYVRVSDCGRYSVCKIGFNGAEFYESWRTRAHPDGPHLVATNLPTFWKAQTICEEDANDAD